MIQLSDLNIFSLFLSFTVLGALIVLLGHLRRPNLDFCDMIWYDMTPPRARCL